MAVELAPQGVRVVSIAPTFVATPLSKPFLDDPDTRKWILGRIPLGRVGTVEEVASAVVFLASPAAALVTGSSLLVDGGWTAWEQYFHHGDTEDTEVKNSILRDLRASL